jgi:hypothetical protein
VVTMEASLVTGWSVERLLHFEPGEFLKEGSSHFGFHDAEGRLLALDHKRHRFALLGADGTVELTAAGAPLLEDVPHVAIELRFPMYADVLEDGTLVLSNLDARLYRLDTARQRVELLVDGPELGMTDMGNCVVDAAGFVWVNEVTGCRLWRFDRHGRPALRLGDGTPGFDVGHVDFERARFSWIYDIRHAPDGRIFVLDSRNYALRTVDPAGRCVETLATGFGSNPSAHYDGPISLSLGEDGNAYVGDRWNHVVRMVAPDGRVTTIAGDGDGISLPAISSMDYHAGRLYVPTDLPDESGDLYVLRRD